MNQIDTVRELAIGFVNTSNHVFINDERIKEVAKEVAAWAQPIPHWGFPRCIPSGNIEMLFLYELIANSVNYCFWYGRHDVRPNGADSTKMYSLLDESFMHLAEKKKSRTLDSRQELILIIDSFIGRLCRARFPLMDSRMRHLDEIKLYAGDVLGVINENLKSRLESADLWLDYLITSFPGYSRDLFLKRAMLFIIQMYRRCGLFAEAMPKILVPADYQIPKMLRWMGCIEYVEALDYAIATSSLIPSGSNVECEIRAATIVACSRIAAAANCTCEEVDTYLFSQRYICTAPFHLTVTTDY